MFFFIPLFFYLSCLVYYALHNPFLIFIKALKSLWDHQLQNQLYEFIFCEKVPHLLLNSVKTSAFKDNSSCLLCQFEQPVWWVCPATHSSLSWEHWSSSSLCPLPPLPLHSSRVASPWQHPHPASWLQRTHTHKQNIYTFLHRDELTLSNIETKILPLFWLFSTAPSGCFPEWKVDKLDRSAYNERNRTERRTATKNSDHICIYAVTKSSCFRF